MADFDRYDVAEAHCLLEWDYNVGGWLHERPSNQRRMEATAVQLHRLKFKPRSDLNFATLSENSRDIYLLKVLDWDLPRDQQLNTAIKELFSADWLKAEYPLVFAELYPLH